jgi:foldase protein PrsA
VRIAAAILALTALLALTACGGNRSASSSPVTAGVGTVAQVGSNTITPARLDAMLASAKAYYKNNNSTFPKSGTAAFKKVRSQAIEFLVQSAILEQAGAKMGIKVTDKQITNAIANVKKQSFSGNEKKFEAGLEQQGLTIPELRNQQRTTLYETAIRNKIVAAVRVSDAQAKAYYTAHPKKYMTPASRPVRHILVAKRSLAETIYRKLKAGASFTALVKRYSTDSGSRSTGGKYTDTKGSFVPAFENVAFALETKQLSKPVHSRYGWHVIQALADTVPAHRAPFADAERSIKSTLLQTEQKKALNAFVKQTYASYCNGKQIAYANGYAPTSPATNICASVEKS